jgi:hypothetical protein
MIDIKFINVVSVCQIINWHKFNFRQFQNYLLFPQLRGRRQYVKQTSSLIICTPSECDILVMQPRRIRGSGHVTHVREGKCVCYFLMNPERKRPLGKPRCR